MIFHETAVHPALFLLLCYAGAGAGMIYDLLSFLRRRAPGGIGGILDILWCLTAGALCLWALIRGGEDRIRGFALPAFGCGAGVYALGVRQVIMGAWKKWNKRNIRN